MHSFRSFLQVDRLFLLVGTISFASSFSLPILSSQKVSGREVAGPAGDDHRAPGDLGPVRQADHEMPGRLTQRGGRTRAGEVGAELLRLHNSPLGEVAAGDPIGNPR